MRLEQEDHQLLIFFQIWWEIFREISRFLSLSKQLNLLQPPLSKSHLHRWPRKTLRFSCPTKFCSDLARPATRWMALAVHSQDHLCLNCKLTATWSSCSDLIWLTWTFSCKDSLQSFQEQETWCKEKASSLPRLTVTSPKTLQGKSAKHWKTSAEPLVLSLTSTSQLNWEHREEMLVWTYQIRMLLSRPWSKSAEFSFLVQGLLTLPQLLKLNLLKIHQK